MAEVRRNGRKIYELNLNSFSERTDSHSEAAAPEDRTCGLQQWAAG